MLFQTLQSSPAGVVRSHGRMLPVYFYPFDRGLQDDTRYKINVNGLGNFESSLEKSPTLSGTDSLLCKAKPAEAAGQMKVQFVDRGPGAPVGM
jgi:hypothetical protein